MPDHGFVAHCDKCGWIASRGEAPRLFTQLRALDAFDAHKAVGCRKSGALDALVDAVLDDLAGDGWDLASLNAALAA